MTDRFLEFNIDVLHCSIILIPIWTEHSAVLLCRFDVYSMIISKLILAKFSVTSHLSYNRQNLGILLNNCLCMMVLISICHCLVRVCARACVCGWECVSVFIVCLFCMPCVIWVWMFFVLLFYVIYSRTIASIANVFCWLYPTLNKVLSYLFFFYLMHVYKCKFDVDTTLRYPRYAQDCFHLHEVTMLMLHKHAICSIRILKDARIRKYSKLMNRLVNMYNSRKYAITCDPSLLLFNVIFEGLVSKSFFTLHVFVYLFFSYLFPFSIFGLLKF